MTEGARRRFTVTVPDWGSDHLSTEAVVAFVDDELAPGPFERATRHLAECAECAGHVAVQSRARSALRTAETPCLPLGLLSALRSIPQDAELPPPPDGLAVTEDGQLVDVLRTERMPVPRRSTPASTSTSTPASTTMSEPAPGSSRRMLFGATAAVSGLALGALALGVSGAATPTPAAAERGVFNGSVLGGSGLPTDAGLRLPAPGTRRTTLDEAAVRTWLFGR